MNKMYNYIIKSLEKNGIKYTVGDYSPFNGQDILIVGTDFIINHGCYTTELLKREENLYLHDNYGSSLSEHHIDEMIEILKKELEAS